MANLPSGLEYLKSHPVTCSHQLRDVIEIYKNYLLPGCEYLYESSGAIFKLLESVDKGDHPYMKGSIEASYSNLNFLKEHVDLIEPIYKVVVVYNSNIFHLLNTLILYKDSLLIFLQNSKFGKSLEFDISANDKVFSEQLNEIFEWNKQNPFKDIIMGSGEISEVDLDVIKATRDSTAHISKFDTHNVVIAGSMALKRLIDTLKSKHPEPYSGINREYINKKWYPNFIPNDMDIVYLNSEKYETIKFSAFSIEVIHSTHKKVSEMLLSSDIPCCRVAVTKDEYFYFSAKAIGAIFGQAMIMPVYTKDVTDLTERFFEYSGHDDQFCRERAQKCINRINKYTKRGFTFEYRETSEILPSIFRYK
jgi:hypothetical protein